MSRCFIFCRLIWIVLSHNYISQLTLQWFIYTEKLWWYSIVCTYRLLNFRKKTPTKSSSLHVSLLKVSSWNCTIANKNMYLFFLIVAMNIEVLHSQWNRSCMFWKFYLSTPRIEIIPKNAWFSNGVASLNYGLLIHLSLAQWILLNILAYS